MLYKEMEFSLYNNNSVLEQCSLLDLFHGKIGILSENRTKLKKNDTLDPPTSP